MIEVLASDGIESAQKGPLHAAGPGMVDPDFPFAHDVLASVPRHGPAHETCTGQARTAGADSRGSAFALEPKWSSIR